MAAIHFRILGYVITIAMHVTNSLYMINCFQGDALKNAYVRQYQEMQLFFFTCWTFSFQIIHAILALYCDISTLKNSHLPKELDKLRDTFFTVIVWPSTLLVSSVFWVFFYYDRSLFYPVDIDLALPSTSNHIMHSFIVPVCIWEVVFKPRSPPRVHRPYLWCVWMVEVIYVATLICVYLVKGKWVYPIFGLLLGSVYFYLFFVGIAVLLYIIYYAQWALNRLIWGSKTIRVD